MRKIKLFFTLILAILCLNSCVFFANIAEKEYVLHTWLDGRVINLYNNSSINISKNSFVENGSKTVFYISTCYSRLDIRSLGIEQIYLQPTYDNKPVIYVEYPYGMPIPLVNIWASCQYGNYNARHGLGKPILMTNGFVEFADSSYNGYIILPVVPNSVGVDFERGKISFNLKYKDRNGNLRNFNIENLIGGK